MKVYSEPGHGTSVEVYLPRLQSDLAVDNEERPNELAPGERGETILIVEDDEDVRAYLTETLRDFGYSVIPSHDSVAALGFLHQESVRVDLMLTDVVRPGISGRRSRTRHRRYGHILKSCS